MENEDKKAFFANVNLLLVSSLKNKLSVYIYKITKNGSISMWRIISEKRKKSTESFLRVPHRTGKPGKWQGIFQSGKSQGILNRPKKSGKITQNTGKLLKF